LRGLLPAARSQSFMVVSWDPVTTCGSWNDQKIHQQHRNYINMAWHNLQNHRIRTHLHNFHLTKCTHLTRSLNWKAT
jgi:hypothetical protein